MGGSHLQRLDRSQRRAGVVLGVTPHPGEGRQGIDDQEGGAHAQAFRDRRGDHIVPADLAHVPPEKDPEIGPCGQAGPLEHRPERRRRLLGQEHDRAGRRRLIQKWPSVERGADEVTQERRLARCFRPPIERCDRASRKPSAPHPLDRDRHLGDELIGAPEPLQNGSPRRRVRSGRTISLVRRGVLTRELEVVRRADLDRLVRIGLSREVRPHPCRCLDVDRGSRRGHWVGDQLRPHRLDRPETRRVARGGPGGRGETPHRRGTRSRQGRRLGRYRRGRGA